MIPFIELKINMEYKLCSPEKSGNLRPKMVYEL